MKGVVSALKSDLEKTERKLERACDSEAQLLTANAKLAVELTSNDDFRTKEIRIAKKTETDLRAELLLAREEVERAKSSNRTSEPHLRKVIAEHESALAAKNDELRAAAQLHATELQGAKQERKLAMEKLASGARQFYSEQQTTIHKYKDELKLANGINQQLHSQNKALGTKITNLTRRLRWCCNGSCAKR